MNLNKTILSTTILKSFACAFDENIAIQNCLETNKNLTYAFAYDNLSRIRLVSYTNTAFLLEKFAENSTYDKHGNIKAGEPSQGTYGIVNNLTFNYASR